MTCPLATLRELADRLQPALDEIRALADSCEPEMCDDLHAIADAVEESDTQCRPS